MAGQPRWVRMLMAVCAALVPVLTVLQAMGFTAARDARRIVEDVEPTLDSVNACVRALDDPGGECSLDGVVGQVQAVTDRIGQLPDQLGADLETLRARLSPDQLARLLDQAVRRGVRIPRGPPGPPGPAGSVGPPGKPADAAPTTTTTTDPGGNPAPTRPGSTTTTTRPRPPPTTTTTRPCDVLSALLGRC